ncbi:MAG: carbohydrate kinase family protein [Anaerolineae bacterium]|nr:carbohydrate kinase family protein [Anaerolineae bacterium]
MDVVGLGYCSLDYLGIVPGRPEFDVDTVSLSDFAKSGGGPVSTALVALARLGACTGYIGVLGEDEGGAFLKGEFEQEGVDLNRLRVQAGARSQTCMVLVEAGTGRRSILCYRAAGELLLDEADRAYISSARYLHLDGNHMDAAITAACWARADGVKVSFDANRPRRRLDELLPLVDILIASERFPPAYTGKEDQVPAGRSLLEMGPEIVVITLGARGCLCLWENQVIHVPGFQVDVVDSTGAGDAFHGAFLYGLLQGWELGRTAIFANAVAAINCTRLSGRAGLPSLSEVEVFLKEKAH